MQITPMMSCTQGFASAEGFDPVDFVFIVFPFYIQAVADDDRIVDTRFGPHLLRMAKNRALDDSRVAAFGPLN